MLSKYILLLLSSFLLVQCANGKALTSLNESDNSTTTKKIQSNSPEPGSAEFSGQVIERNELVRYILGEALIIAGSTIKTGQKLLSVAVAEASKIEDKSEGVVNRIKEYSILAEKLERLSQNHGKLSETEIRKQNFNAVIELITLLDNTDVGELEKSSLHDQVLSDLVKKNGLEELEKEFRKNFVRFSNNFIQESDRYWNSLSSEEQQNNAHFKTWIDNYKTENNVETKIPPCKKFFESLL